MQAIHWQANPGPQEKCLAYEDVDEKLFGGSRGGGKTDAGLVWMVPPEYVQHPKYRGLVIRRNSVDLSDWIDRARWMYKPLGAVVKGNPAEIHFPSGAVIRTGHLKDDGAYTKYQGHEYQRQLIEEVSHIQSEDLYEKLIASCRSTIGLPARVMCTSNPDGDGRLWVKRRFVDPAKHGVVHRKGKKRLIYIHSTMEDNPHLMTSDPGYVDRIDAIADEDLRKAWRFGDWDTFAVKGSIYGDKLADLLKAGRFTKVSWQPELPVYTYWDLGMSDSTVILFVQFVNTEVHVIDMYEMNGESLEHYAKVLQSKPYVYGRHKLPHDVRARELGTGKSREEVLQSLLGNSMIDVVDNIPVFDGINAVRTALQTLWIDSEKCRRLKEAIETYRREWDDKLQVYRPNPVHDWSSHACDALRYLAVSRKPDNIIQNNNYEYSFQAPQY